MEVISANIGEPVQIEWRGQYIETGIYKYSVNRPIFLGLEDVENDHVIDRRYHGGVDKACYLYSADRYPFWKNRYPGADFQWGMFGENLTISGLDESVVKIGDQYRIGEALVQVTQPRQPCFKLGIRFGNPDVVPDFWSLPYPGVYLKVLERGAVKAGDSMILLKTNPDSMTVAEVFSLFKSEQVNNEIILKAVSDANLAASCRRDLEKLIR
jgi:Uncharacterized protein conserved in bacteria